MDLVANTIREYEQALYQRMRVIKHIHPPITSIENTCLYCKVHGNVFRDGVAEVDYIGLSEHVLPVSKACEK